MKTARKIQGFFNWTFFVILAIILVLVNIVASFVNVRVDATKDKRYSLSQGTKTFLSDEKKFDNRLYLKIYLDGNLPADLAYFKNTLEDKLVEFKQYAGDRIEYEFLDPNQGTEAEKQQLFENLYNKGKGIMPMDIVFSKDGQQSQMLVWPGAVMEYAGSTVNVVQLLPGTPPGKPYRLENMNEMIQNAINNLEYILISSIRRAVENKKPVIGFLQGHGELHFGETQRARALISPYYALRDVQLNDSIEALNGLDGLIIADPKTPFSSKDLYLIDQFLMRGGRLMCFVDALDFPEDSLYKKGNSHTNRINTNLLKTLFDYGIKVNDNYVLDARCAPRVVPTAKQAVMPWYYDVLATPTSHPISRNIEPVKLSFTSEIQFIPQEKVALTPVLTSSTNSMVTGLAPMVSMSLPISYGNNPKFAANPKDESNKLCVAGLAEGYFQSAFRNRLVDAFAKNPESGYLEKGNKEAKLLVVGNGRFIANDYDTMTRAKTGQTLYKPKPYNDLRFDPKLMEVGIRLFYGNQEFFQNLVDYMMGDNSILDIRSRQIDIHQMDAEKVQQEATFYKILNLLLPSGIVLIFAVLLFYFRKKKYASPS